MLQNYLKIGLRNLLKNKLFTAINISGMAISITCFFIISLFIYDELNFDRHIEDVDLKFRIYSEHFNDDGSNRTVAMVPPMIAPTMKQEYPEIDYYGRLMYLNSPVLFKVGEEKGTEASGGYADPEFLTMFSLRAIEGSIEALQEPNTMAISKTVAEKYFKGGSAVGQTIEVSDEKFNVVVVFEDFPQHSHLQLRYFLSMKNLYREIPERMESWGWSQFHTYVKLLSGADAKSLDAKLMAFAERHAWEESKQRGSYYVPHLMPLKDVHLHASDHLWDIAVKGNVQTVYILLATAFFILVIAILNFINLSTARAINRVKEVGVRKVVGAFRSQLIAQFISESVVIALIALLIAGVTTELLLPTLNAFTEKNIPTGVFLNPVLILTVLLFAVLIGVAAGAYPAFYISGYKPAHILSNKKSGRSGKTIFRMGLVVFQFILSFLLIIAALVISAQHEYMRSTDMGFQKENLLVVQLRGNMRENLDATKQAFSNHENIISATLGYGLPGEAYAGDGIRDLETNKEWSTSLLTVDHDYPKTLDLKFIAGRDFNVESSYDLHHGFIISEKTAEMLGYTDPKEAIGHKVGWPRWDNPDSVKSGSVIGVVQDFHLNSLHEAITPVVLHIFPFAYSSLTMRIKSENIPATLEHLESTWKKFNSDWPFEYRFLDDNFDRLYKTEEKLATLFSIFTAFTIFVACLGLFGLVVYSTSQRYKEISIRKVLGADEGSLIFNLSKSYMVLIALAFVVAIPIGYYAAKMWLEKFTYRIELTPVLFIKAALLIFLIAIVTVGLQALKAARSNPVDALKEQ